MGEGDRGGLQGASWVRGGCGFVVYPPDRIIDMSVSCYLSLLMLILCFLVGLGIKIQHISDPCWFLVLKNA